MHGSASKIKATYPPGVRFGRRVCLTWSRALGAGGTVKMGADWAFVSGVSPVSPNLKLIDRIQRKNVGYGRKVINRPQGPYAETGGTGVKVSAVFGETAGVGHAWDSWDPSKRDLGASTRRLNLVTRLRGSTLIGHTTRQRGAHAPN
jgi:hypothetical protein